MICGYSFAASLTFSNQMLSFGSLRTVHTVCAKFSQQMYGLFSFQLQYDLWEFYIFILSSGCDTQNCTKMYLLKIQFHWVCSWVQLVFFGLTLFVEFLILYYVNKNKLLIIKELTTVIKLYLTQEEVSSILANGLLLMGSQRLSSTVVLEAVDYFCKKPHPRCLTGYGMRLCFVKFTEFFFKHM